MFLGQVYHSRYILDRVYTNSERSHWTGACVSTWVLKKQESYGRINHVRPYGFVDDNSSFTMTRHLPQDDPNSDGDFLDSIRFSTSTPMPQYRDDRQSDRWIDILNR
ncbi:hypothetical protein E1B28_003213 [Marasmius oreades]|uniref:Uncharacterized protein n=1 Tax=Marasmius oreades TaxID=181124 RepID=A0A9P7UK94_9AGAR|nr:uncharacterized protein E1B28_003213 [Marasmius oreades]KAG7085668.1 hypothetical protein E1B28_003213 [Marasmius oreades]